MSDSTSKPSPPTPASQGQSRDQSEPALRAFFRLAEAWGLSAEEQQVLLGRPERSTYLRWKKDLTGPLDHDVLNRISHLLGIYKALHILFPVPALANGWVRRPNGAPIFAGRSAVDRMLLGHMEDLRLVHQYLDAQRR